MCACSFAQALLQIPRKDKNHCPLYIAYPHKLEDIVLPLHP